MTPNNVEVGMMSEKCWAPEHHGRCCCNCKWHIKDYHHCTTLGQKDGKCVCNDQKGWICLSPISEDCAYSGWSEHGMCEMHEYKKDVSGACQI